MLGNFIGCSGGSGRLKATIHKAIYVVSTQTAAAAAAAAAGNSVALFYQYELSSIFRISLKAFPAKVILTRRHKNYFTTQHNPGSCLILVLFFFGLFSLYVAWKLHWLQWRNSCPASGVGLEGLAYV